MAGSLRHITNNLGEFTGTDLIENGNDAWQALEECHGIIMQLADGDLRKIAEAHWRYVEKTNPNHGLDTSAEEYWSDA